MRLLDLYCCAGGCSMGYYRAGFTQIVGVDLFHQKRYPFTFVRGDAIEYLLKYGADFDFVHASPPCQRYSEVTPAAHRQNHPDLIGPTRDALRQIGRPYAIENVENARGELISPLKLCGSMFGLKTYRHRYFELWPFTLQAPGPCNHNFTPLLVTTAGCNSRKNGNYKSVKHAPAAYGIDWMTGKELAEAIPPAYTEYIGRGFLQWIGEGATNGSGDHWI